MFAPSKSSLGERFFCILPIGLPQPLLLSPVHCLIFMSASCLFLILVSNSICQSVYIFDKIFATTVCFILFISVSDYSGINFCLSGYVSQGVSFSDSPQIIFVTIILSTLFFSHLIELCRYNDGSLLTIQTNTQS